MLSGIFNGDLNTWLIIGVLWSLPWKGIALWKAARLHHQKWFVILFVVNTFAVLEIIYIFRVARKYQVVDIEE